MVASLHERAELAAYLQGWDAFRAGRTSDQNKYEPGNVMRRRWFDGFFDHQFYTKYRDKLWARKVA